uniref:Uncharacterized protein n=1 Tax=Anguilla anguilla TaxID=7936 RepID=A0A0E9RNM6_ANGAN
MERHSIYKDCYLEHIDPTTVQATELNLQCSSEGTTRGLNTLAR